jgi:hypothetical protein
MLFILKNDLTIPKSEIIVKSASIAVALNCELPTSVNLPNFFSSTGNFFLKYLEYCYQIIITTTKPWQTLHSYKFLISK